MNDVKIISERELRAYRADLKNEIFRQIRVMFQRLKISQKELAAKLSMDEAVLSRRLRGENDMRLESFTDLARGLDCRIDVQLTSLDDVRAANKSGRCLIFGTQIQENFVLIGPQDTLPSDNRSLVAQQFVANCSTAEADIGGQFDTTKMGAFSPSSEKRVSS